MTLPSRHFRRPRSDLRGALSFLLSFVIISIAGLQEPAAAQPGRISVGWITQFATDAKDEAVGVAVEGSAVFVAGYTSAAFPGQVRHHRPDAFVRRYDESGAAIWTDQFGTDVYDYVYAIDASPSGVYIAGSSNGRLSGSENHREFDAFVRAYDYDGNAMWTRQFGGRADDYAYGVAADDTRIYVVGYTHGVVPHEQNRGRTDAFIQKFRLDGRLAWTRQFGSAGHDEALAVAVGSSGVYVAGYVGGALPGEDAQGGFDAFVRRYTQGGHESWTHQFGTSSTDKALGIALGRNSAFVVGSTAGSLSGGRNLGGIDAFARKYRLDGRLAWTRLFGTEGKDVAADVTIASHGTIAIGGWTDGGFSDEINSGGDDAFLRIYEPSGRKPSTLQVGSSNDDEAAGIAANEIALYLAGVTEGSMPGAASLGEEDAFLAQIGAD